MSSRITHHASRITQSESVIRLCAARSAAALPGSYPGADHAIFPESQLSAMAAQGYELGQRLAQYQRQRAGDPVN